MPDRSAALSAFDRLLTIMDELREKCPWDREQTLQSLRHLTIEETYELSETILSDDLNGMQGELGDLLLHIVFYTKIASEKGAFEVEDMINRLCDKLIRRHPHIYGNTEADTSDTVKQNWERIKLNENPVKKSVLGGVPAGLPALVKSFRIQEKVGSVGFEWKDTEGVIEKIKEEIAELQTASDADQKEAEFGDLLFSLVNYARYLKINPEDALERTNRKFIARFRYLEDRAADRQMDLAQMTLEEMDILWEEAKQQLKG